MGLQRASSHRTITATRAGLAEWLHAMRWRRRVEAVLVPAGLTFTQWLVLRATQELVTERRDAVNQREIGARVELDPATISQVMRTLEKKQLVSRGIDMNGTAWRVFLEPRAERLLCEQKARLEAASAAGQ